MHATLLDYGNYASLSSPFPIMLLCVGVSKNNKTHSKFEVRVYIMVVMCKKAKRFKLYRGFF